MDKRTICLLLINILLIIILVITKRRKQLKSFVLLAFTFVFVLSTIEFVYRSFFKSNARDAGDTGSDFYKFDSLLGYTINKPGSFYAVRLDRKDTIFASYYNVIADSTQSHLDFNHRVAFQSPESKREVVFMGCSITFGIGLDDTASMAYKTGQSTGLNTVNAGIRGYGTHQVYQLFLNKYAGVSNANRVFVYSFIHDHILRANGIYEWNISGPYFKINEDSLIHSGSLQENVEKHNPKYIHYLSGLGTFSFLHKMLSNIDSRRRISRLQKADFDRCFLMIKKMTDIIQKTGGQFILLDWERHYGNAHLINDDLYSGFEKQLEELKGLRIIKISSILDPADPLYFIPKDGHPSALANEKLANALSSMYLK